jgi:RHS repeat-associated protein
LNHATNVNNGGILMAYDGDGNRVRKTVSSTGVTTYYLVDDRNPSGYVQVVEEWTGSGSTANLSRVYNYGLGLISQAQPAASTCYFITDGHGSTRMLVDNNDGVQNAFAYDAYGSLIASNTTAQTAYLYGGQQWDSDLGIYYNRARYLNQNTGRFWTMDTSEGDQEDPKSLHLYNYGEGNPVDNVDPSGHDAFDLGGMSFDSNTPNLEAGILSAVGLGSTLPVKTLNDTDIDGQLNAVYGKIRKWEKGAGGGPVAKEPWHLFVSMMKGNTVDTIWRGTAEKQYLYQYNGTEYPRLLNRTFINSDINYLGFGVGYCARGILGLHAAIREHLWVDYNEGPYGLPIWIGKRPSDNTFAAADTGYDWAENKFWPSGPPRHGSGN